MVLGDYFCPECGTANPAFHNSACPNAPEYMRQLHRSMAEDSRQEFLREKAVRQKAAHFCSHCGKDIEEGKPYKVANGKKYHKLCYKYRRI